MYQTSKQIILQLLRQNLFLTARELNSCLRKDFPFILLVRNGVLGCSKYQNRRFYYLPEYYNKLPGSLKDAERLEKDFKRKILIAFNNKKLVYFLGYESISGIEYPIFESMDIPLIKVKQKRIRPINYRNLFKMFRPKNKLINTNEKERHKVYYRTHKDYFKSYQQSHKEIFRLSALRYYHKHKELNREYNKAKCRRYYLENKDYFKLKRKEYSERIKNKCAPLPNPM